MDRFSRWYTAMIKGIDTAFSRWVSKPKDDSVASSASAPTKVTSRVDISIPDQCPVCKATMGKAEAHGIPVYVCHKDRVVLPQPD